MKNSQRILDSIGKLDDSLIDNALSYKPASDIKMSSARPVKRVAAMAAAAVMCVVLAITCFANAEGITEVIKSIFSREEELIDPYAAFIEGTVDPDTGVIKGTVQAEGISMTVDKIVRDGDNYLIYIHLRNPAGFEPGFLFYDRIEIEQQTSKGWKTRYELAGVGIKDPQAALLSGTSWTKVESKTQDLDLFLKVDAVSEHFKDMYEGKSKNNFRISVYDLATIQIITEDGGYPKCFDPYFDKVSVEFDFDESKVEPLPEKISYPNIDFELDGTMFRLTEMRYSPMHLSFVVEDPNCEIIEVDGLHFYATGKINFYMFCEEYPPTEHMLLEDSIKLGEFVREHNLLNSSYSPVIETPFEDNVSRIWRRYITDDEGYNVNKIEFTCDFERPLYEEDIKSLSFKAYIHEKYPVTQEDEYTVDNVLVWTNPDVE